MKVNKVINNNVISVLDQEQKESVVMGKGIGFQMKPGDPVDEGKIEKVFVLNDPDVSEKFKTLLREIPIDIMDITEQIIQHAKNSEQKTLNDMIYVTLPDHINFAVQRHREGYELKNALLWEIKKLYKEEFLIGKKALLLIQEKLGVQLLEDEAGFIALHLVNAEMNDEKSDAVAITKMIQQILTIVKYHFSVQMDEDSLNYFRFITHLKFFAQRLLNHTLLNNKESDLFDIIQKKKKDAFACSMKIHHYIRKEYQVDIPNEELMYLTIHIERVMQR